MLTLRRLHVFSREGFNFSLCSEPWNFVWDLVTHCCREGQIGGPLRSHGGDLCIGGISGFDLVLPPQPLCVHTTRYIRFCIAKIPRFVQLRVSISVGCSRPLTAPFYSCSVELSEENAWTYQTGNDLGGPVSPSDNFKIGIGPIREINNTPGL